MDLPPQRTEGNWRTQARAKNGNCRQSSAILLAQQFGRVNLPAAPRRAVTVVVCVVGQREFGTAVDNLYVTREGLDKLQEELASCKSRRMEVAAIIEHARGFGDLRENADYHAAKEEQAMLHARIRDLEDKVARSVVLEDHQVDISKAYTGSVVRVLNKKTKKEFTYTLVSPVEADMAQGKISVKSPVGLALLGKAVGETAMATVPAGNIEFEILEISR